ncbi:MAG: hypothetical protein M3R31_02365 [Pseudomonadota bacterium]|nr:hypothetical protein [Pseudomonadota bacterium]
MYRISLAIVLWASLLGPVSIAAGEPRRHVLDVYGEGFAFEVREPPEWFVDSTIASEFGASVIFYPNTRDPHSPGTPVIRIVVLKKISGDTGADLRHTMDNYRSRYHNVEFRDSAVSHPRYRAYSKLFCLPGKFCEYVTYLNPGPASSFALSVSLTRPKHAATAMELAAYKRVIATLDAN